LPEDRIVAVGLLTQQDVDVLGPTFQRLWPVEDVPCFRELVEAIDEPSGAATVRRSARRGWHDRSPQINKGLRTAA
jgi:hypothetical protein